MRPRWFQRSIFFNPGIFVRVTSTYWSWPLASLAWLGLQFRNVRLSRANRDIYPAAWSSEALKIDRETFRVQFRTAGCRGVKPTKENQARVDWINLLPNINERLQRRRTSYLPRKEFSNHNRVSIQTGVLSMGGSSGCLRFLSSHLRFRQPVSCSVERKPGKVVAIISVCCCFCQHAAIFRSKSGRSG